MACAAAQSHQSLPCLNTIPRLTLFVLKANSDTDFASPSILWYLLSQKAFSDLQFNLLHATLYIMKNAKPQNAKCTLYFDKNTFYFISYRVYIIIMKVSLIFILYLTFSVDPGQVALVGEGGI